MARRLNVWLSVKLIIKNIQNLSKMKLTRKNLLSVLAAGLITLGSFSSFASSNDLPENTLSIETENLDYSLYAPKNTSTIWFAFNTNSSERVMVKIYDKSGELVYAEANYEEIGKKSFDLSAIGKGTYNVSITQGGYSDTHTVTVGEPLVEFKGYISSRVTDNKVSVVFEGGNEPVLVTIANENGQEVFTETYTSNDEQKYVYNLSDLEAGTYDVQVMSGDEVIEKTIDLD